MMTERHLSAAVAASCAGRVGSLLAAVLLDDDCSADCAADWAADCAADMCHVGDCAAAAAAGLGLQQPSEQGRPALVAATAVGPLCEGSGVRAAAAATSSALGLLLWLRHALDRSQQCSLQADLQTVVSAAPADRQTALMLYI